MSTRRSIRSRNSTPRESSSRLRQGLFNHPHGFYVDHDSNVWTTDNTGGNGKGHQVIKFGPDGKVLLTLGKPGVAGEGPDMFNAPNGCRGGP